MSKKNRDIFYDTSLNKRHIKDKIFKYMTLGALVLSLGFLIIFLTDMVGKGVGALQQTYIQIEVRYDDTTIKNYRKSVEKKYIKLVSRAWIRDIKKRVEKNPTLTNTTKLEWVLADDQVDMYIKNQNYKIKPKYLETLKQLKENDRVLRKFNRSFFSNGDSKSPEYSGIASAMVGTIFALIVAMTVAFPIGVATAIYLEEFANPDSKWSQTIEININNLAAVPSILFGLLGLAVFINLFGLPRSSAIVGGLTLALMTLPIIVVSSRAALRSVPASIRQAGYSLGLSKTQVVKDHVLPLAFPGIMTGSIIGMAQAMGETAPLIIVGMVAFVPDSPISVFDAATVMPAQIFTWAGMPETAYIERTALGILVLLTMLISLNIVAIYIRKKFETRW